MNNENKIFSIHDAVYHIHEPHVHMLVVRVDKNANHVFCSYDFNGQQKENWFLPSELELEKTRKHAADYSVISGIDLAKKIILFLNCSKLKRTLKIDVAEQIIFDSVIIPNEKEFEEIVKSIRKTLLLSDLSESDRKRDPVRNVSTLTRLNIGNIFLFRYGFVKIWVFEFKDWGYIIPDNSSELFFLRHPYLLKINHFTTHDLQI
ncbi:MAG: hypothetical protein NTX61_02200 [Bacteroidetes bacterium]|nr:hypothetical protein [Bacteroidota bacterium]